ncbi:hypothetical protein HU200_029209 [Digitaria exilis]|uniref:GATA-type domain-containing protein n=1 Tax=Digitaria exilis TaxID=1010633 RepID=A0A835ES00_9POAL|nr:hypothetical protein HU200_029209 [Digitaria exilis]CAB3489374.1 unnamed protein product [Digitaria exilis]
MRAQSHLSLHHVPDDLPDCDCEFRPGGGLCCPDDPLELVLQFFPGPAAGEGSLASIGIGGSSPLPLGPGQEENGFGDLRALVAGAAPGCCGGAVWEGDSRGLPAPVPEDTETIDVDKYLDLPDCGGGGGEAAVCNPFLDMTVVAAPTPAGGVHACRALAGGVVSNGAPPPVSAGALQAPYTFHAFDGVACNDAPPLPPPMAAGGGLHACGALVGAVPKNAPPIHADALHACGGVVSNNATPISAGALQVLPLRAHAPPSPWTIPASRTSSGCPTPATSETDSPALAWQPIAWVLPRKRRRSPVKFRKRRPWSLDFPLRAVPVAVPDNPDDSNGNDDAKNSCYSVGGGGIRRRRPVPRQRNRQTQRVCSHCHSPDTPQWRAGPDGPGTLCNACGIRYAANKLLPEYRPSTAPSFRSDLHSNRHRKVVKLREQKAKEIPKAMPDESVPVLPKGDEFMDVCTYISTGL